jgi:hypothetical protein
VLRVAGPQTEALVSNRVEDSKKFLQLQLHLLHDEAVREDRRKRERIRHELAFHDKLVAALSTELIPPTIETC